MGYQKRRQEYWSSPEFRWRNAWLGGAGVFFAMATSGLVTFFYASGRLEVPAGATASILILRSVGWLFGYSAVVAFVLILFNAFAVPAMRRSNSSDS